ncbi:MAG: hypothetical protein ACRELF_26015 [Gemmataceae bacterium]
MMKWRSWRGGVALCLASALLMTSLGCQPGGTSGSAPSTNKPSNQKPDNKGKPGGHHEPDPG